MSYILDALKKAQAEQNAAGLPAAPAPTRSGPASIWLLLLTVALALNAAILGWFVWDRWGETPPGANEAETPRERMAERRLALERSTSAEATDPRRSDQPPNSARSELEASTGQAAPRTDSARPKVVTATPPRASATPPPAPAPARPASSVPRVSLASLSPIERAAYESFSFTSHIYTDDPELCAVVIDGERLRAGDAFKGLKVVAITETGVVFEENRRGEIRQVVVSPFGDG